MPNNALIPKRVELRRSFLGGSAALVHDDYLASPGEAALFLDSSTSTLAKFRGRGGGPPFIRLSPRKIAYRVGDLKKWVAGRQFNSTSEY